MVFRALLAGLLAWALVIFGPLVLPRGLGGVVQPWDVMLRHPVIAWRLGYYLEPYRQLSGALARHARSGEAVVVKVERTPDGSLAASNLPAAPGRAVTLGDGNADLMAPTQNQGLVTMATCWLLLAAVMYLLLPARWFMRRLPARYGQASPAGVLVPYDVLSRRQRPMKDITPKDITPADDDDSRPENELEPRNEQEAARQLVRRDLPANVLPPTDPSR